MELLDMDDDAILHIMVFLYEFNQQVDFLMCCKRIYKIYQDSLTPYIKPEWNRYKLLERDPLSHVNINARLTDEDIERRKVNINNKIIDSIISNIHTRIHFMLVWSPRCPICPKFIPIYLAVSGINFLSHVEFTTFEVEIGSQISNKARDSLISLVGVPSVILFINGCAVKDLGWFKTQKEFLETIKTIMANIKNINVRIVDPPPTTSCCTLL